MSRDVLGHPFLSGLQARGEGGEHVVRDPDHDLDPSPPKRPQRIEVGVEELHLLEPVLPQHPHHYIWVQRVGRLGPPVRTNRTRETRGRQKQHEPDEQRELPHELGMNKSSWGSKKDSFLWVRVCATNTRELELSKKGVDRVDLKREAATSSGPTRQIPGER